MFRVPACLSNLPFVRENSPDEYIAKPVVQTCPLGHELIPNENEN